MSYRSTKLFIEQVVGVLELKQGGVGDTPHFLSEYLGHQVHLLFLGAVLLANLIKAS